MSAWYKRGEKTDCVSPWMQSWSVLDCAQESWQYVTCQVKESGCCLILYCFSSPQRDGNLVWLRDDYISIVCTVCLRNLKVLGSPCVFLNQKHVQGTALCPAQRSFHWLCIYWQKGSWMWQKTGWGISPSSQRTCLESWLSSTTAPTPSLSQVLKPRAGTWFFFIFACRYTGAQSLGNTGGI